MPLPHTGAPPSDTYGKLPAVAVHMHMHRPTCTCSTCSVSPMKMGARVSAESTASQRMALDMKKRRVKAKGLKERTWQQ